MNCFNERGPVFPTVADLSRESTIVITARPTTSHATTVTAPLSISPPKSPPAPHHDPSRYRTEQVDTARRSAE
jgi:hypothetical protein